MRNYYFITVLLGLLFMGCTVDNDELTVNEDQIQTLNLEVSDVCMPSMYEIENSGKLLGNVAISNSNAGDIAYVKFTAETGLSITEIRLFKADDESELPINNGGLILGKLEKLTYSSVSEVNLEYQVSNFFFLAARVTFVNEEGKQFTSWIGDIVAGNNNSTYLSYNVCIPPLEEPVCEANAGGNVAKTFTYREIDNLVDSVEDLEALLKSFLDEGVSRSGTFEPSAHDMLRKFYFEQKYQDFVTKYTVTNEVEGVECSDSADFVITIIR